MWRAREGVQSVLDVFTLRHLVLYTGVALVVGEEIERVRQYKNCICNKNGRQELHIHLLATVTNGTFLVTYHIVVGQFHSCTWKIAQQQIIS